MNNANDLLERRIGLGSAISVVLGSVIGSGVFLVATSITKALPSPAWDLSVWVVAGVLSFFGGLVIAELGAAFPGTGGPYVYLSKAFSPLLGFLYGWTLALVIQPGSIAAVAVAFAEYASQLHPALVDQKRVLATALIAILTVVNLLGVRQGTRVLNLLNSFKTLPLLVLGGAGLWAASHAGFTWGPSFSQATSQVISGSGYGVALIAAFWAYDGWNNVAFVAGEVKRPQRNLPLALFLGLAACLGIYLLVNLAYYRIMPVADLAGSNLPASDVARILGGPWAAQAMIWVILVATSSCVSGMVLSGARVSYAMAADGELPRIFAYVHPTRHVPSVTLLFQMLWSAGLVWMGSYDQLFTYIVCAAFVFYGLTGAALISLRVKQPGLERPYKTPLYPWIPAAYVLFCIAFVVNTCIEKPWESLTGLGIVALGVPLFYWFRATRATVEAPAPLQ